MVYKVKLYDKEYLCEKGKTLIEFIDSTGIDKKYIIAAKVDNKLVDLKYKVHRAINLELIKRNSEVGMKVYRRSLCFLFIMAVNDVLPNAKVTIEHSLGNGIYSEIYKDKPLNNEDLAAIEERMRFYVNKKEAFERIKVTLEQANSIFEKQGQPEKVKILTYKSNNKIYLYKFAGRYDHFFGILAPHAGYVNIFKLKYYLPGVILMFPDIKDPEKLSDFIDQHKLASIYQETEKWGKIMKVDYVSSLNDYIKNNKIGEIIRINEALHEKKIAGIADMINANKETVRLILIAGPSSSGKTTFAQRLYIQLRVNGLNPVPISLDDYYLPNDKAPRDSDGKVNFEDIEALDINYFNEQLMKLIQGEEVVLPIFDFTKGRRAAEGRRVKLNSDQPIIVEGIHGLNEKLTHEIPKERKFKIYISALTQLNLDEHNRITTTDSRLIRRIVRDNLFRSTEAEKTLEMWNTVRRGEERNIFPYQEEADVMFNSALVYELSILKKYAENLLLKVTRESKYYYLAQSLLDILSYIKSADDEKDIPANSIIREFIGNSCFF